MTPERWKQIEKLYHAALLLEPNQQSAFLKEACTGDEDLRREVELLLAQQPQAESFIESPALEVTAQAMAETRARSMVGRQLGAYKIVSLLGAGGMGEVYRAKDTRLDRTVAIKVLPAEVSNKPEMRQRFEREARVISSLSHPHICALYDIGRQDGVDFLVMEYLEGETLANRLTKGPLSMDQALRFAVEIADALDQAHRHEVVHRDLKPGNIMLTKSGVKLLDFGLAKHMGGTRAPSRVTERAQSSASNPRNPNHPPKRVRTGPRSQDEMGHVWLQVLPKKESEGDPRVVLQEALMRRRLEKYPSDFAAHCNLGALLATRGEYREAISNFEQALRVEPASATARNGLGAGFLAEGRFDDAIRQFREALRVDPAHLNARLNLARALKAKGDLNGAAAELDTFLKQKPDNADAQSALGLIYFMQRRYEEALPHFREAVRFRPEDADIQTNLGAVLASRGDLAGAVKAFEEALKLNPNHEVARACLARARAELGKKH